MTQPRIYRSERGARRILARYRTLLDEWPVPADQRLIPTGLGETFVVSSGPVGAPPLVLLHGSGTNSAMWRAEVPAFARNFRVHSVDIVGEPGLSAPARPELGSPAYADWLDEVLDGLDAQQVALVGASLDAWFAAGAVHLPAG